MTRGDQQLPPGATCARIMHRVQFHETDAMRVVHHANYVHWFEHARVAWLDDHDVPYAQYVEAGLHFATTRLEVDYERSARFDDRVEIATWLEASSVARRNRHVCVKAHPAMLGNARRRIGIAVRRNLSTPMRHSLVLFTEQFLLSLMLRVS